jgi:hypothetical protein
MDAGVLDDRPAAAWRKRRHRDLDQELVRLERGGQVRDEEVLARESSRPPLRGGVEARAERGESGGELSRRVGVGDRAADRSPRADLRVADQARRLDEERPACGHER